MVKNLPATKETVFSPGLGRSPGEGKGYPLQYSSWRIPWTEEPGGLLPMEHAASHDLETNRSIQEAGDQKGPLVVPLMNLSATSTSVSPRTSC